MARLRGRKASSWDDMPSRDRIMIEPDAPVDSLARRYADVLSDHYHDPELFERIRNHCQGILRNFGITWSPTWNEFLRAVLNYFHFTDHDFASFFLDNARANHLLPPLTEAEKAALEEQDRREREYAKRAALTDVFLERS